MWKELNTMYSLYVRRRWGWAHFLDSLTLLVHKLFSEIHPEALNSGDISLIYIFLRLIGTSATDHNIFHFVLLVFIHLTYLSS